MEQSPRGKRIAFALPAGTVVGGVETWSIATAERLRARGRDAVLLEYPLDSPSHPHQLGVPPDVPRVACLTSNWGQIQPPNLAAYRSVLPALVVPNYSLEGYGICATLSRRNAAQLRTVGFCHSFQKVYFDMLVFYEPVLHKVVAVSEECAEVLRRRLPHRAGDIEVRPYPVAVPEKLERSYSAPGEPLRLLYAGRVVEQQKRVSDLLALARELHVRGVDFHLRIVGEGEAKRTLAGKVARLDAAVRARVSLEDGVPHPAMPQLLRDSDVAVLVSAYEGASLFLLEALAWGCVPVVTAVSGTKAVVEQGVTGYRVPVGAMGDMAAVLARIAADRDHLRVLGTAGSALARQFAVGRYQAWLENLIDSAWEGPPRSWPEERPPFRLHQRALSLGGFPCARRLWRAWLRYYRGRVPS
jgi:glycosyltransferase involved in cell wall biosynthesis